MVTMTFEAPKRALFLGSLVVLSLWIASTVRADATYPAMEGPPPVLAPSHAPQDFALAQSSLVGPSAEVTGGVVVGAGGILVGAIVSLLAGPGWFCEFETDDSADYCAEKRRAGRIAGTVVGLGVSLIGVGLVTHGAYRIRRIRVARRDTRLPTANLDLTRERASFQLGWRF
jgi:hypothetical protein